MTDTTTESKAVLAELTRLEARRQQNIDAKQRQFKRYVVRGEAELVPGEPADVDRKPVEVHLRDISRGGLGFVCDRKIPVNSNWHVVFFHQGLQVARQPVVIRHCQSVNNGLYLVGALFCIEAGLLSILGVDTKDLHGRMDIGRDEPTDAGNFLAPSEVA